MLLLFKFSSKNAIVDGGKFIDENSVEAVPSSWIRSKHCFWPSFQRDKVIQAIRKNKEPDMDWPLYEVIIFRNSTYGT